MQPIHKAAIPKQSNKIRCCLLFKYTRSTFMHKTQWLWFFLLCVFAPVYERHTIVEIVFSEIKSYHYLLFVFFFSRRFHEFSGIFFFFFFALSHSVDYRNSSSVWGAIPHRWNGFSVCRFDSCSAAERNAFRIRIICYANTHIRNNAYGNIRYLRLTKTQNSFWRHCAYITNDDYDANNAVWCKKKTKKKRLEEKIIHGCRILREQILIFIFSLLFCKRWIK